MTPMLDRLPKAPKAPKRPEDAPPVPGHLIIWGEKPADDGDGEDPSKPADEDR